MPTERQANAICWLSALGAEEQTIEGGVALLAPCYFKKEDNVVCCPRFLASAAANIKAAKHLDGNQTDGRAGIPPQHGLSVTDLLVERPLT